MTDSTEPTTLDELFKLMKMNHPSVLSIYGQWRTDLPEFGGPEPHDTTAIWSWDADRIIVGRCADDLTIEARAKPTLGYDPTTLTRGQLMRRCGDQGIDWSGWGLYAYVGVSRCGDYLRMRRVATCGSINKSVTLLPACALWPVSGRVNFEEDQ